MEIRDFIDREFGGMLECLDRLIRIPSVRSSAEADAPFGKETRRVLEEVLKAASEMGFAIRNYENQMGIVDLCGGLEPAIGILCHADVVPAGAGWIHAPYRATLDGDKIYGRGAIDDKGPLVSVLYAMKYLKDFCPPLRHGVRLLIGTDEECGSQDLSSYRQQEPLPPIVFTPDAGYPVINTEKGRAVASFLKTLRPSAPGKIVESASGGGAVNAVPDRAEALVSGFSAEELYAAAARSPAGIRYDFTPESGGRYRILAAGKSAHASAPGTGENAVTGLIALLSLIEPDWKEIAALFPHGETDGTSLGISCADSVSGALTASFDVLSYRAPDFVGTFDIRFPLGQTDAALLQLLRKTLDAGGFALEGYHASEPHHTPPDSLLVRTLLSVYEEASGKPAKALATGGGTYAHGIPGAVAFGPEVPGDDNHMHAADEFIRVSDFKLNTELMIRAVSRLDEALTF